MPPPPAPYPGKHLCASSFTWGVLVGLWRLPWVWAMHMLGDLHTLLIHIPGSTPNSLSEVPLPGRLPFGVSLFWMAEAHSGPWETGRGPLPCCPLSSPAISGSPSSLQPEARCQAPCFGAPRLITGSSFNCLSWLGSQIREKKSPPLTKACQRNLIWIKS